MKLEKALESAVDSLKQFEIRTAPKTHPDSGTLRFPHWYQLRVYSDGSGRVVDSASENGEKEIFLFKDINELAFKLATEN